MDLSIVQRLTSLILNQGLELRLRSRECPKAKLNLFKRMSSKRQR